MRFTCPACRRYDDVERLDGRWYCAPCDLVFTGTQREWDEMRRHRLGHPPHIAQMAPTRQPTRAARAALARPVAS